MLKIGEMNGRWALLFKTVLVCVPLVSGWAVMAVRGIRTDFKEGVTAAEHRLVDRVENIQAGIERRLEGMEEDVSGLSEFAAETRGNRFTSADGLDVWKEIANIKEQVASIDSKLPSSFPLPSTEQDIHEIRQLLVEHITQHKND